MRVLVTGGSGLLGSHVILALRARGDAVRALVRERARATVEALGAEAVTGDVTDPAAWTRAAAGVDGIVHAAALVLEHLPFEAFRAVNVGGTERALAAAAQFRAPLVHISSVSVYGRDAAFAEGGGRVGEDYPFQPIPDEDFYARSKREAELLARRVAQDRGLAVAAIRPNVLYGERDRYFAPRVARVLLRGIVLRIGRGDNRLSCVYAGNVASAVLAALDHPPQGFRAYNTTNDSELTQREFFDAFAAALGVHPMPVRVPLPIMRLALESVAAARAWWSPRDFAGVSRTAISFLTGENPYRSDRARDELSWRPAFSPLEGLARTANWIRKDKGPGKVPGPEAN